jgi:hypothetical protein
MVAHDPVERVLRIRGMRIGDISEGFEGRLRGWR